ncbi:hypothetical protein C2W62_38890 [Candidatus Entotheonella serta]|nr:hypothetical protein C2W62_38890 [Candidatus Entotheonella serta]
MRIVHFDKTASIREYPSNLLLILPNQFHLHNLRDQHEGNPNLVEILLMQRYIASIGQVKELDVC